MAGSAYCRALKKDQNSFLIECNLLLPHLVLIVFWLLFAYKNSSLSVSAGAVKNQQHSKKSCVCYLNR